MTTALEGGEWSASRAGRSLRPGKDPVPIAQEAGWSQGPVWTGAENLTRTGIRSPDRPARSQSLYRLRYPGSPKINLELKYFNSVYCFCVAKYLENSGKLSKFAGFSIGLRIGLVYVLGNKLLVLIFG